MATSPTGGAGYQLPTVTGPDASGRSVSIGPAQGQGTLGGGGGTGGTSALGVGTTFGKMKFEIAAGAVVAIFGLVALEVITAGMGVAILAVLLGADFITGGISQGFDAVNNGIRNALNSISPGLGDKLSGIITEFIFGAAVAGIGVYLFRRSGGNGVTVIRQRSLPAPRPRRVKRVKASK